VPTTLSRTTRRFTLAAATLVLALAASTPEAEAIRSDLTAFLERTERMATHTHPVRADITITKSDGATTKAVAIVNPKEERLFYAANDGSWRALAPLEWDAKGKVSATKGAQPTGFGANDRLGDTDLRALAFFPFWSRSDYGNAFISDNSRLQKTVTLYPTKGNPYMLLVLTFDKEKMVPETIKYYSGEMNNLVRLEMQSDYKMVGARPLAQKIIVNNYEDNTTTTYAIEWTLVQSLPEALLDESTFHTASLDQ